MSPTPADITYRGFTHQQLKAAFDAVADPTDWKAPVDAMVYGGDYGLTHAAVEYFTATTPTGTWEPWNAQGMNTWRITAPGYRNGPAN